MRRFCDELFCFVEIYLLQPNNATRVPQLPNELIVEIWYVSIYFINYFQRASWHTHWIGTIIGCYGRLLQCFFNIWCEDEVLCRLDRSVISRWHFSKKQCFDRFSRWKKMKELLLLKSSCVTLILRCALPLVSLLSCHPSFWKDKISEERKCSLFWSVFYSLTVKFMLVQNVFNYSLFSLKCVTLMLLMFQSSQ